MGTRFELVLGEGGVDPHRLRSIGEAALAEIEDLDRRWSVFRRDSLLSFVNRNAFERPVRLDADTFALLSIAEQVRRDSGGLFDVRMGGAMRVWGFREEELTAEAQRTQRETADSSLRSLSLCGESLSV